MDGGGVRQCPWWEFPPCWGIAGADWRFGFQAARDRAYFSIFDFRFSIFDFAGGSG
jgi:hypothetical protein